MDHQGPRSSRDLNNNKVKLVLTGSKPEFIFKKEESIHQLNSGSNCISAYNTKVTGLIFRYSQ